MGKYQAFVGISDGYYGVENYIHFLDLTRNMQFPCKKETIGHESPCGPAIPVQRNSSFDSSCQRPILRCCFWLGQQMSVNFHPIISIDKTL